MSKQFDAKTQKWVDLPEDNTPEVSEDTKGGSTKPQTKTSKDEGKATQANKNFAEAELTYLTGDANVEPNSVTLSAQAGNTVEFKNLGSYLSGLYYLTEVKTVISTSGLSLTYSVLKNGFGKTLKPYVPKAETSKQEDVAVDVSTTISSGDTVKFIESADAVYSNVSDGVKVPDWVKKRSYTVQELSDDKQRALLKEIVSWTYTKYLQKV